jgi:hypothetical protein
MEIQNKSKRPLSVPLPGGKRLHLGPGKTGQITPRAAEHGPLKKLIEDGALELLDGGQSPRGGGSGSGKSGKGPSRGGDFRGGVRHTGDR